MPPVPRRTSLRDQSEQQPTQLQLAFPVRRSRRRPAPRRHCTEERDVRPEEDGHEHLHVTSARPIPRARSSCRSRSSSRSRPGRTRSTCTSTESTFRVSSCSRRTTSTTALTPPNGDEGDLALQLHRASESARVEQREGRRLGPRQVLARRESRPRDLRGRISEVRQDQLHDRQSDRPACRRAEHRLPLRHREPPLHVRLEDDQGLDRVPTARPTSSRTAPNGRSGSGSPSRKAEGGRLRLPPRRRGRVVRQRPAKPRTPVRFWSAPLLVPMEDGTTCARLVR